MGRLLAKMPVVDLHYDETNKNLFCITDERLFVVQVNKYEVVVDLNFKDEILKRCSELISELEHDGPFEPMQGQDVFYLASDLTMQDEDTMSLTIYANLKVHVASKAGTRSENLLAQFVLSSGKDQIDQEVLFLEVVRTLNENLLEGVTDALFVKTAISEEEDRHRDEDDEAQDQGMPPVRHNHLLVFEQRSRERVVAIKLQPHHFDASNQGMAALHDSVEPNNAIATAVPEEGLQFRVLRQFEKLVSLRLDLQFVVEDDGGQSLVETLLLGTQSGERAFQLD